MNDRVSAETADIVIGMVRLAEGLGYALPWANLLDACTGLAERAEVRRAVDDLIDRRVVEATTAGLRFALSTPAEMPPGETFTEPSCSGSLRTPQRATTLPHGAEWGHCRGCGNWCPLNSEGVVKAHVRKDPTND